MKPYNKILKILIISSILAGSTLVAPQESLALLEANPLVTSDCNKCHMEVVKLVFDRAGQHKEALDCLDCHTEHPPEGTDSIPICSICHEQADSPHFAVPNCLGCHNPHSPLDVKLGAVGATRTVCASCHREQDEELETSPSAHSDLDCAECHQEHGTFFNCLECHEPHSDKIGEYSDCLLCHKPHMPTVILYPDNLSVSYCSSCHAEQTEALLNSPLKHSTFLCVFCHRVQHKTMPACYTCHGRPHALAIHRKFPSCHDCHDKIHVSSQ